MNIKKIVLDHIIKEYGQVTRHDSGCLFPEQDCSCENINEITEDSPLISSGIIDSFSMVSELVYIEKYFNINILPKDATPKNFNTVNDITNLINKYLNE